MRIINPTKPEIGRISNINLDKVNKQIKPCLGLLQWIGTTDVINWFKGINSKLNFYFIHFTLPMFKNQEIANICSKVSKAFVYFLAFVKISSLPDIDECNGALYNFYWSRSKFILVLKTTFYLLGFFCFL